MNKSELSARVAEAASMSRAEADTALSVMCSTIAEALAAGETVSIAGFGTFSTRRRAARQGRNPRTGESIAIPASNVPAFKAGKALRGAVNQVRDRILDGRPLPATIARPTIRRADARSSDSTTSPPSCAHQL